MKTLTGSIKHSLVQASIILTACLSLIGHSEIYKRVDEKGKVIFSDQPAPQAEAVKLPTLNTTPAIEPRTATKPETADATSVGPLYSTLAITSPKDKGIIPNGLIAFPVNTLIKPALQVGHVLQLSIDGKVHSTHSSSFTINGISRGPHRLQLAVIDDEGNTLLQSAPVSVFVYRPSN